MDSLDLISFSNSKSETIQVSDGQQITIYSPGNNPFDSFFKDAQKMESHQFLIEDNSLIQRESLGILTLEDLNTSLRSVDLLNTGFVQESFRSCTESVSSCSTTYSQFNKDILRRNIEPLVLPSEVLSVGSPENSTTYKRPCSLSTLNKVDKHKEERTHSLPELETNVKFEDDAFNDSVFIEANHIAAHLANGSHLEEYSLQNGLLDCTTPPSFEEIEIQEPKQISPQTMFKTIDKMLPINNESNCNTTSKTCNSGSSKEASELLQHLSVIITNENRSAEDVKEGQQLINNLSNILHGNNNCNGFATEPGDSLEDSGHSSIAPDEALEELKTSCKSDSSVPLSKHNEKRRLSQSFSTAPPKPSSFKCMPLKSIKGKGPLFSNEELNKNLITEGAKLKPIKAAVKPNNGFKGPLKAIIPIGDMSKDKSSTPIAQQKGKFGAIKTRKSGTPTVDSKLKPIAQSTPDDTTNVLNRSKLISSVKKRSLYCPMSPLSKNSFSETSANSMENSKQESKIPSPNVMLRRHSATELQTSNKSIEFKRSNSIGTDFKAKYLKKIGQRRNSLSTSNSMKSNVLNDSNTLINGPKIKRFSLLSKLKPRKFGKENMEQSFTG